MDKLPLYRFIVSDEDEETGVDAVALVAYPAIEMNWQAFSAQKSLFTSDNEKRIISGPLMVAELPIYRRDESGFEYYGMFTAKDIYSIVKKFFRNGYSNNVNMMHDSNLTVSGVYMIESFIIDSKRGILPPTGYNLTEGSWFGSFKVDNEDVWDNYIKTGDFKGFSVEGMFDSVKISEKPQTTIDKIIDVVKGIDATKVDEVMSILKKANIN